MINRLIFFGLFFHLAMVANAQIQDQEGEIKLNAGESVTGNITFLPDDPNKITVIQNKDRSVYAIDDIDIILLNDGRKFISGQYPDAVAGNFLLLQSIIESPKISLFLSMESDEPTFYVRKEGVLHKLENNVKHIDNDGKKYKSYDHQYIGILTALMNDNPDLTRKLETIDLNEKDLVSIITQYNKGDISYFMETKNKYTRSPNWLVFAQYSRYATYWVDEAIDSYGVVAGLQYYFSKEKRSSLKFSIEYAQLHYESENDKLYNLSLRYQFDLFRKEKYNIYLMMQMFDISHYTILYPDSQEEKTAISFVPRFSPGTGFEYKPVPKFAIYGEVNHLLQVENVPGNFSLGIKYDL